MTLGACGGEKAPEAETEAASTAAAGTSAEAGGFPEVTRGKGAGTITGTIGANALDVEGVCSKAPKSFDFWTDGTDFASANDVDGDGQYLTVNVMEMQGKVRAALRYGKDGETIYNGLVSLESFDGNSLRVDTPLGREQKIEAEFTISCD